MEMTLYLRRFAVTVRDERTGETREDHITISKGQLQAAQAVGQSSKELIYRHYNRQGFTVLDIGKAEKRAIALELGELWELAQGKDATAGVKSFLQGFGVTDREDRKYFFTLQGDGHITLETSDDSGGEINLDFSKKECEPLAE